MIDQIDWEKCDYLLPAIIQNVVTKEVLMMGYMNQEALKKTLSENIVTFYSRTKKRLWTKGESSNNFLKVSSIHLDCDRDTILVFVNPQGPTCHLGSSNCFNLSLKDGFLFELESIIAERLQSNPAGSYVCSLFKEGIEKIAQKVGEESVETIIAALKQSDEAFINEGSDLVFHFLLLLKAKNISLVKIAEKLASRHERVH